VPLHGTQPIKDPPFSRLDLLSCRNMLIYLEPELQQKLLRLSHYALRPGGYLFLGPAETIAGQSELFRPLDLQHRIFQKTGHVARAMVEFPLTDVHWPSPRPGSLAHASNGRFWNATRPLASFAPRRARPSTSAAAQASTSPPPPAPRPGTSSPWLAPACGCRCAPPCSRR